MKKITASGLLLILVLALSGCQPAGTSVADSQSKLNTPTASSPENSSKVESNGSPDNESGESTVSAQPQTALATFGSGCFWCTEAVFQEVNGVEKVESGYSGGDVENPSYREVCSGTTGHAEVVQVTYDPGVVSFEELLEIFWQTHDPTTLNRQGADVGTQYRSVVFFHDERQKEIAQQYKQKLDEAGIWPTPIVTEISPFDTFYVAEVSHQDYFRLNPNAGYCQAVIVPKLEKFRKVFKDKLKSSEAP